MRFFRGKCIYVCLIIYDDFDSKCSLNLYNLGTFLFVCNGDSKYCLICVIVVNVTLVKQCLEM